MTTVTPDPMNGFHPAVRRWFEERFREPTPPQRDGWRAIRTGRDTLISAPTGSGKTLAAFLDAVDGLFREGVEEGELPEEIRVIYVSPLKALSADIHRNLAEPRREIRRVAREMGLEAPKVTAAVRTGDTSRSDRRRMVERPPHILVTTPESLYLLLTAERSREILRTSRTVIVDEIHAVLESRRGSHLALSLERLDELVRGSGGDGRGRDGDGRTPGRERAAPEGNGRRPQRIGLSATQRPIEEVARFLVGAERVESADRTGSAAAEPGPDRSRAPGDADCEIVDRGHLRDLDLGLELPGSPLEAVMSGEVWDEVYDRLAGLVAEHRTTLVFVNTRRQAERVSHRLTERVGPDAVTAHHGSLSKETRQEAERRLKEGGLRALVATASLELGIDVGVVDLVCQLGSPHRISAFLQRVGRSGHTLDRTPKGRLFPETRDDLLECAALLRAARAGELDRARVLEKPYDILTQQLLAAAACREWGEEELFALARRAWPYRNLSRAEFDELVRMASRGFDTRRGRRGALLHHDPVNGRIRGRKGARLYAITCGGAIPDNADYRVVLEPEGTYLGTLNEDFAVESLPGDIVQLGNASWRIRRVETGVVRVEDARGEPPNIPFWLGEAPTRSTELSEAVSRLRSRVEELLEAGGAEAAADALAREDGLGRPAARQIVEYLADAKRLLGALPDRDTLVLERFFDESGGMQLVLHAPLGSRVNRAWGLALRKRFCRKFNFELQAAATEEGILLSLGPQHSFPLEEVFRYLHPDRVEEILVQAALDAPMFQTRWRWNATLSLALPRWRGGSRTPPQIQRMEAEDLLSAVFPDATACLEHVAGDRSVPDHPLVRQTLRDCLTEVMDLPGLQTMLRRIRAGEVELVARDLPEPSPLAHELLTARPFAYLDDAPLEERRAQAVYTRRALEPSAARALGALDPEAVERVRREARPEARGPDEAHDALLLAGFLAEDELGERDDGGAWLEWLEGLAAEGRACRVRMPARAEDGDGDAVPVERVLWCAVERLPELRAVHPGAPVEPELTPPEGYASRPAGREEAIRELLGSRMEMVGPTTALRLGASLGVPPDDAEAALAALEGEGAVLRGAFTVEDAELEEWCERRLLARIHRYTLERLRAAIRPVSAADYMRFLFRWQRVEPGHQVSGREGLLSVIELLDGFELPAGAWEVDVLTARCADYDPELLDELCQTGRVGWGRLTPPDGAGTVLRSSGPLRSSPVALYLLESADLWLARSGTFEAEELGPEARTVARALEERGACFFHELASRTGLLPTRLEAALGELAASGLATADRFAGLRALLTPSDRRRPVGGEGGDRRRRRGKKSPYGVDTAGRWSLLRPPGGGEARPAAAERGEKRPSDDDLEAVARAYLLRYGVVFRRVLAREPAAPPWRRLVRTLRRMEARGEVRGGRFVKGFSGEQFALPEAVTELRKVRKEEPTGELVAVSAADPLNLTGVVTAGERVPAVATKRIGYRDGVPVWMLDGDEIRALNGAGDGPSPGIRESLVRRRVPPELRSYVRP